MNIEAYFDALRKMAAKDEPKNNTSKEKTEQ